MSWLGMLALLADAPAGNAAFTQLIGYAPIILLCLAFWFMVIRPSQLDARRRAQQLAALKKNDRVYTSSGIIGTIANISQDGREITLKVDDNVKIRIFRRSIEGLYTETPSTEGGSST